jgi:16S rRNA (cytosine1402-N4)-methyltransferase
MATKWEKVDRNGDRTENDGHVPVLIAELLHFLQCRPGGAYLDCTVGYGGLGAAILEASAPDGVVIGIDRDADAIAASRRRLAHDEGRVHLIHGDFRQLKRHLEQVRMVKVDGVIFDLGVSSAQLDRPERGFSFAKEGPLDMRMDLRQERNAADLVNGLSEVELADLIYRYGEERYSRRIARAIVRARGWQPLTTTQDLVSVLRDSVPAPYRHGRIHFATRTFQALRIAVNQELEGLDASFRDAADVLAPGGRLCIISFHSLEDRIAKRTIRALTQGPAPLLRSLTKKPHIASDAERGKNPRARSAKLRVAERVGQEGCA